LYHDFRKVPTAIFGAVRFVESTLAYGSNYSIQDAMRFAESTLAYGSNYSIQDAMRFAESTLAYGSDFLIQDVMRVICKADFRIPLRSMLVN